MALNRRQLILGALLCASIAATVWVGQDDAGEATPRPASDTLPDGPRLPSRREAGPDNLPLQIEKMSRRAPTDTSRNAFANRAWTAPPPVTSQPAPVAAPSAPPLPFIYMGKMQEGKAGPVTVYLTQGEQSYRVRQGDVIDRVYRVESIDAGQIVLTYLPLAVRQTLSFGNS